MLDFSKVRTYSIKQRKSKVCAEDFAKLPRQGESFSSFMGSLPRILQVRDLCSIVDAVAQARRKKKTVLFMAGAHVIKCGLGPLIIWLMKKKLITCVCLNGAGVIHDFELAFQGKTSEDVAASLSGGDFGMGSETAEFINNAVKAGVPGGEGFGYSVASRMRGNYFPHKDLSILYSAYRQKIPLCVHLAIGTDIIHQHPSFDAAASGQASYLDFRKLVEELPGLNAGGVVLNFGSAVIMPEVFLKALNLARNLGAEVKDFTTANFDMAYHYRPAQNIVSRPVIPGGKGYYMIGHHEIMLPLFAQALAEKI